MGIRRIWKICSLSFLATLLSNCAAIETVQGKVYVSDPHQHGIVRSQAGELIPYEKTKGFYCISPEDLELFLVEWENSKRADRE